MFSTNFGSFKDNIMSIFIHFNWIWVFYFHKQPCDYIVNIDWQEPDLCLSATSGPVSARLLVDVEAIAVGMTVAVLVFPLQCFLCFMFRKAHRPVT